MVSHPFADRIHWLGMRADMDACYQAMDLLVSPSEIEGLSNAVLEAMATGVPVLAHEACGNNEVVRNGVNGILRDLRDADALASAIRETVANPENLTRLGLAARQHVVDHFSLDSMADAYLRTYQSIVRDRCGTP
jgi:glycosyltransferase involved in cell wall biosynthesis